MSIEDDIQSKRLGRLNKLIDEDGGQAELAHEINVIPGYINQLVTKRKNIRQNDSKNKKQPKLIQLVRSR